MAFDPWTALFYDPMKAIIDACPTTHDRVRSIARETPNLTQRAHRLWEYVRGPALSDLTADADPERADAIRAGLRHLDKFPLNDVLSYWTGWAAELDARPCAP